MFRIFSSTYLGFITFIGKNVTRPNLFSFKYFIASSALEALSTIILLKAAPKEVVIAVKYVGSTSIIFPTISPQTSVS